MRRRSFIGGLLGVATTRSAWAQPRERVQRIGTLMPLSRGASLETEMAVFSQALDALGWKVGTNPLVESRWASDYDRMLSAARALVRLEPNVLLVGGAALPSAVEATQTIPIVFVLASDELVQHYVKDFARPNGNATGFTSYELSLVGKRLELLKEIAPHVNHVAFIHSPRNRSTQAVLQELVQASPSFAVTIIDGRAENSEEVERIVRLCASEPNCGLVVAFDAFTTEHREEIVQLTADQRLPTIYPFDVFARSGGLLSYGVDRADQFRQAASYVDRIMKGAKVDELPIQAATKFKMVVNLKAANVLGLTIPPSVLAQADEVIE